MIGGPELPSRLDGETLHEAVAPPYVSFNTFRTLLDWLRSEGVPLRFDRSFWQAKFSGSTGTQLVATLRFLGLLQGDRPLPDLESLVDAATDERRFILKELLKDSYATVPFDELDRATPAMVRRWFRAYPVDGHTLRKAISFFVNAVRDAEMPMSNAVRKMARSKTSPPAPRAAPRDRRHSNAASPGQGERQPRQGPTEAGPESSRTRIALESGGAVTLDLAVDLFQLSERDRDFVLRLVDLTRGYQSQRTGTLSEEASDQADVSDPLT